MAVAFLDACSGEEAGEGIWVVIAARAISLQEGHAAKLGGPDDEGVIEHAALFEIGDEGRSGLVHDLGLHRVSVLDIGVGIPVGNAISAGGIGAIKELDDADALFEKAAGEDAVLGIFFFEIASGIGAVLFVDGGRLALEVHDVRDGHLHFSRHLVGGDAGGEIVIGREALEVFGVELLEKVDGSAVMRATIDGGAG